jgi:hypothetical protein
MPTKITQEKQSTENVNVVGVNIPVAKKNKNMLVGAAIGGTGTAAVLLLTPFAPFALVGGMLGFGAGGLLGKAFS